MFVLPGTPRLPEKLNFIYLHTVPVYLNLSIACLTMKHANHFWIFLLFLISSVKGYSQCYTPSDNGDTLLPVINRVHSFGVFGNSPDNDRRQYIYKSGIIGNTLYAGGSFQYIGPNTGSGVILDQNGSQLITARKWRVNGPVYSSVPDGAGGFYIGGAFTRIGDSACYNIAHINNTGEPYNWKPQVNDVVQALAIKNDTLIIGGKFSLVNGQTRHGFAMLNTGSAVVLPAIITNTLLTSGTIIHTFELADSILYVGGKYNIYNTVGALFKVNIRTGSTGNLPQGNLMDDVFALAVNDNRSRLFAGGQGGSMGGSNGYCINLANAGTVYTINAGVASLPSNGAIFSIKLYGSNVYAGGRFDFGSINGNAYNQKGLVVFDTATGQIRNYLSNCDGFVTAINASNGSVYIGGEFTAIGGQSKTNFAVFDTLTQTISSSGTLAASDQSKCFSFSGSTVFAGGFSHSWGCVKRNGLAAFDINTGEIKPWQTSITVTELNDIKSKGDTLYMAGVFSNGGAYVALNAITGTPYPHTTVSGSGQDLLFDGDYLYVGGSSASNGNTQINKIHIPTLSAVNSWSAYPPFNVKSLQKKGNTIYAAGDNRFTSPVHVKGFVAEITDNGATATLSTVTDLTNNIGPSQFYWMNDAVLAGDKLYITGYFDKIRGMQRNSFAVINTADMSVSPVDIRLKTSSAYGDLQFINGHIYLSGSFDSVNNRLHRFFAVIDTTVGAVFPDRLRLNNDQPFGYSIDDFEWYLKLNTFQLTGNNLLLGGNFRNVNQKMFPSLAKLTMLPSGAAPSAPEGINGSPVLTSPGLNHLFTIQNANPDLRYAWFYTGSDVAIRSNGTDSIYLDAGPLATPGILKAVAINECGKSDTAFLSVSISTVEPVINASNLLVVRKTDTTATVKFTPGNGARRIVVVRAANPVSDLPADAQEYNADNRMGLGANLGNNTYAVYKGTGDSVNISGLIPESVYHVSVFELNGINTTTNYLTAGYPSISFNTFSVTPTVQASTIVFSNNNQTSFTVTCTPGNGAGRLVIARLGTSPQINPVNGNSYTASTVFGSGTDLGSGNFVVSTGTVPVTITNLVPNTVYTITVFEFNGTGVNTKYLLTNFPSLGNRTIATEPTTPASNIIVSAVTNTSCTINCTAGNGQGRIVMMRKDNPVTFIPQDGAFYGFGSSSAVYGTGTDWGGGTYLLNTGTPVNVTGLTPGSTYHIAIFEYNGFSNNANYLVTGVPVTSFTTTMNTPTVQASNLYFTGTTLTSAFGSCNSGNGTARLLVIRQGSPIINNPVDGIDYTASLSFGQGSDIGNNTYVLAKVQPYVITSLMPATTYYLKVFEFVGTGSATKYLLSNAPAISITTLPCVVNTWTGAVNNLWEVAGNWTCNTVPDNPNVDVVINNGGNVILGSNRVCRSLNINNSSTLTITTGFTLTTVH